MNAAVDAHISLGTTNYQPVKNRFAINLTEKVILRSLFSERSGHVCRPPKIGMIGCELIHSRVHPKRLTRMCSGFST